MLASQRKAWNDAMRSAGATTLGGPSLARRSDRQKKHSRREKARKALDQLESTTEQQEYRAAARIDALEDVLPDEDEIIAEQEEEDEYDEEVDEGVTNTTKRKRVSKRRVAKKKNAALPKRFKPRSLASILMEEAGRPNGGIVPKYLAAEAIRPITPHYPLRKICPVTGLFAKYTDPKSGVPFANLQALEQIQERVPPWTTLSGATAYYEAVKSLRNED